MSDTTVWIIALAFYAPLHYMGPVLVVFLAGSEADAGRRQLVRRVLIDCTFSMLVVFPLAAFLFRRAPLASAAVLLAAMFVPYAHLWWLRRSVRAT